MKNLHLAGGLMLYGIGLTMSSPQVYKAMARGDGRFAICRHIAQGVRSTHLIGNRLSESIATILKGLNVESIPVLVEVQPRLVDTTLPLGMSPSAKTLLMHSYEMTSPLRTHNVH